MFDYLQKFNALPQNLRDSVSSPSAMAIISDLEKKYKIDLAVIVMKVMVKTVQLNDLPTIFVSDFSLDIESARKLTAELKEKLFFIVSNYLGYNASYAAVMPKVAPLSEIAISDRVIKESGLIFAGVDLKQRLKTVLDTYLKGIRSRVDTRITLSKEIASGGLGLDNKTIDKIFDICNKLSNPAAEIKDDIKKAAVSQTGLEKVRALYEKTDSARDIPYDLSAAIARGEIKKPVAPVNLPVPSETKEKLLSEPAEELRLKAPEKKAENTPLPIPVLVKPVPIQAAAPIIKPEPIITQSPEPATVAKTHFTSEIKPSSQSIPTSLKVETLASDKPNLEAITPVAAPKIVKPLAKVSLWSKLFGKKELNFEIKSMPKSVAPLNIPSPTASVAARRMEAAASFKAEAPVNFEAPAMRPKLVPRVMSPIDELKYLDLTNFRRLGASPAEAIAKIDAKIKLLEKDGYEKKISGIIAWKQNPINKIYLKMGQEALKKGQSLKDYALAAQNAKTPGLLFWEEIELIIKLNNQFMF